MTTEERKKLIEDTLYEIIQPGIKATEAVVLLTERIHEVTGKTVSFEEYSEAFDALFETEKMSIIEYKLPQMDYRIKRFLIPFGTKVQVI